VTVTFVDTISHLTFSPNIIDLTINERFTFFYEFEVEKSGYYGNFFDRILVEIVSANNKEKGYLYFSGNVKEDFSYLQDIDKDYYPEIDLDITNIDLGELSLNENREIVVPVNNKGKSDLIIRNIELNKYCSLMKYDKQIAPGETGNIYIIIKPKLAKRNFNTTFSIVSNDPENSVSKVRISGEIILQ